jgi:4-hydroxybenzoate polyprenyltransferase
MLLYQHYIVQKYGLKKINLAFAVTNGIASLLFAVFVISDLILL